ncbi:hypothetical protein D3C72_2188020 [compost metagenome]
MDVDQFQLPGQQGVAFFQGAKGLGVQVDVRGRLAEQCVDGRRELRHRPQCQCVRTVGQRE